MIRQTLPLLFALLPVAAYAQTPASMPPVSIQSGAQIQIPIPPGADSPHLQVLLAGSSTVLDDERANVQNGIATVRIDADPGIYDIRVVGNDKAHTPLGTARRFQIAGFKREFGRWLFNGSPVAYEGANPGPIALPNLKRNVPKMKLPASISTAAPVKWNLPSFGAEYVDPSAMTPVDKLPTFDLAAERTRFLQQQAALTVSNPNGALFLTEPYSNGPRRPLQEAHIDALAPLVDGIIIDCDTPQSDNILFPLGNPLLKIARRNVEESANFDLPVFARFSQPASDAAMLRAFQDGASNLIVPDGTTSPFLDALTRQAARFTGVVTIEDVGLQVNDFDRLAPILRRAGRVPLLARLPGDGNSAKKDDDKNAESLFITFDSSTDAATLDKIDRAARIGATIYCEGALPPALLSKWGEITKTQITALPRPQTETVTLSEPWFWGTFNDQNFDATQSVTITVKPSMSAQTNDVKGEARETIARPLARFNDDPNAIMLCPTGKGRILWAPFDVAPRMSHSMAEAFVDDLAPNRIMTPAQQVSYYSAVSGAMQAAIVNYTATNGDASAISVALRAVPADASNPKSTGISMVAFFNSSNAPVDLDTQVRGDGAYALDLMTDQPIPVKVRDYSTGMSLQIPANGFRWIGVAKDAQAWSDAGKNGAKARLKS